MIRRHTILIVLIIWDLACLTAFACSHTGGGRCPLPVAPHAPPPPPSPDRQMPECPEVPPESARFRTMRGYCDPEENALCSPLAAGDELALWRRLGDYQYAFETCARRCHLAWGAP